VTLEGKGRLPKGHVRKLKFFLEAV